jgi:hypothetical protein
MTDRDPIDRETAREQFWFIAVPLAAALAIIAIAIILTR